MPGDELFLDFVDRSDWRAWLASHHDQVPVVWLVFFKKHTGVPCLGYDEAVEEALCFGWIDSLIKRLDERRYARKFTPRSDASTWSAANLRRMARLEAEGRMTEAGRRCLGPGVEAVPAPAERSLEVPAFFAAALAANPAAARTFAALAPSYRRHYLGWVCSAKREETRRRRLEEALSRLERGEKLGMK